MKLAEKLASGENWRREAHSPLTFFSLGFAPAVGHHFLEHRIGDRRVLRLIEFGRFAAQDRARRGLGKPETFQFLGFTHICGTSRAGRFLLLRHTARTRLRERLRQIKVTPRRNRHRPIAEQRTLGSVRGAVSNGRPYRDSLGFADRSCT